MGFVYLAFPPAVWISRLSTRFVYIVKLIHVAASTKHSLSCFHRCRAPVYDILEIFLQFPDAVALTSNEAPVELHLQACTPYPIVSRSLVGPCYAVGAVHLDACYWLNLHVQES